MNIFCGHIEINRGQRIEDREIENRSLLSFSFITLCFCNNKSKNVCFGFFNQRNITNNHMSFYDALKN
jgi:hypothetical protein